MKKIKISNIAKSSAKNVAIKPIGMILSLIYTPLLLGYLGTEKYGLWATILSITDWMNYCDVGIGHGLRNILTRYLEEKDYKNANSAISTAYVCLTVISTVIFVVLCILVGCINWFRVFNTTIDMRVPLFISFAFICVNFILALSNTILYSLQKSEMVSIRTVYIQILNIIGLFVLSKLSSENLVYMALLFGGSTLISYIANTIKIFRTRIELFPRIRNFDKSKISSICNLGIKFFVIQISYIFMYTVDNLLITNLFGGESVTSYDMVYKVYNVGYGFFSAITLPIWSGATAALARKDTLWFKKTLKALNIVTIVFCLGYIFVGIIFKPVVNIWLGKALDYPSGLIPLMCIYYIIYTFGTPYCQINNGIGAVNGQVILGIVQGALNIPLSIFFATKCGFGVIGIKLATTILVTAGSIFHPIYYYISSKRLGIR